MRFGSPRMKQKQKSLDSWEIRSEHLSIFPNLNHLQALTKMQVPGRVYQDENFIVDGYDGTTLEKLIGLVEPKTNEYQPDLVYIKVKEKGWQQFFLDTRIGFWEDWGGFEREYEENWYIDYTKAFDITAQTIKKIFCEKGSITIELESNQKLRLKPIDLKNDDTANEISME